MKTVTFDGKFQVVTDETPQGFYVLFLPAENWMGLGHIVDCYQTESEAFTAVRSITELYGKMTTQGYVLTQSEQGLCFSHVEGDVVPLTHTT